MGSSFSFPGPVNIPPSSGLSPLFCSLAHALHEPRYSHGYPPYLHMNLVQNQVPPTPIIPVTVSIYSPTCLLSNSFIWAETKHVIFPLPTKSPLALPVLPSGLLGTPVQCPGVIFSKLNPPTHAPSLFTSQGLWCLSPCSISTTGIGPGP